MQKVKSPFICHSGYKAYPYVLESLNIKQMGNAATQLCHHDGVDSTVSALSCYLYSTAQFECTRTLMVVPRSMHCDSHHNNKDVSREPSSQPPAFYLRLFPGLQVAWSTDGMFS